MTATILFVCAQNICRSPLMAAAFARAVQAEAAGVEWSVDSAGVTAEPGRRVCREAAAIEPAIALHRSRKLDGDAIDAADLVIAASLSERAAIARLRPAARTRTFTLREALLLDAELSSGGEPVSAAGYAVALNSRRGTLELPRRRTLMRPRAARHPLDVEDVHQRGIRAHRNGLHKADEDVVMLGGRIARAVDAAS